MTNLKDKLSASVRQAKAGIQSAPRPVTGAVKSSRAKVPSGGMPRTAAQLPQGQPAAVQPVSTDNKLALVPAAFAFPDRVWPD